MRERENEREIGRSRGNVDWIKILLRPLVIIRWVKN